MADFHSAEHRRMQVKTLDAFVPVNQMEQQLVTLFPILLSQCKCSAITPTILSLKPHQGLEMGTASTSKAGEHKRNIGGSQKQKDSHSQRRCLCYQPAKGAPRSAHRLARSHWWLVGV